MTWSSIRCVTRAPGRIAIRTTRRDATRRCPAAEEPNSSSDQLLRTSAFPSTAGSGRSRSGRRPDRLGRSTAYARRSQLREFARMSGWIRAGSRSRRSGTEGVDPLQSDHVGERIVRSGETPLGHPSSPTPSAPERRSAAGGPVFWLPDHPISRAFPSDSTPSARQPDWRAAHVSSLSGCFRALRGRANRPRSQRRARAGFAPASRRTERTCVPFLPSPFDRSHRTIAWRGTSSTVGCRPSGSEALSPPQSCPWCS